MRLSPFSRRAVWVCTAGLCLLGILMTRTQMMAEKGGGIREPPALYLPRAEILKPFLLGHEGFAADLLWIRALGYVGGEIFERRRVANLHKLVDLIVGLDPRFERVYVWAGSFFMYGGGAITKEKILASTEILEKGWRFIQNNPVPYRHLPNYWMIPQMIGFNYAVELRDKARGAPYMAAAARIPGVPDLYKTFAATLYGKTGAWDEAGRFLEDMLAVETLQAQLEEAEDSEVQKRIRNRLHAFYTRLYGARQARERVEFFEEKIRGLVREWRASLPAVGFDFYLLLRPEPSPEAEAAFGELWRLLFPFSTPN